MYKVEIGGLVVHAESMDHLRELIRNFSGMNGAKGEASAALGEEDSASPELAQAVPKRTPKGAIYSPTEVKIRSVNTGEAMFKLFKGLDNATHTDALRFIASKGEAGAGAEDIKEALKMPPNYKLGGLTAAIRRRAPHYGLDAEQVLIIEYRGIVAGTRILDYRLGPEMLEMMRANGFLWKPKEGKERESKQG